MKAGDTFDLWTVGTRGIAAGGGDRFIEVTCQCGFRGYALESALNARKSSGCPACVANGNVARAKAQVKADRFAKLATDATTGRVAAAQARRETRAATAQAKRKMWAKTFGPKQEPDRPVSPAAPCDVRAVPALPDSTPTAQTDRAVSGRVVAATAPPDATAAPPPKINAKLDRLARRKAGKIRPMRPKVHPADWTPREPKPRKPVVDPGGPKKPYRREITPGERHGRWTVLGLGPPAPDHRMVYVRCDCGTERTINPSGLWSGTSASCGCLQREAVAKFNAARRLVVPVGERFGKLTVLENLPGCPTRVRVKCDCGNERIIRAVSILDGNTRSCGCSKMELRYRTIADQLVEVQWMRRVVDVARQLADATGVDPIMAQLRAVLAEQPPAIEGDNQ